MQTGCLLGRQKNREAVLNFRVVSTLIFGVASKKERTKQAGELAKLNLNN